MANKLPTTDLHRRDAAIEIKIPDGMTEQEFMKRCWDEIDQKPVNERFEILLLFLLLCIFSSNDRDA